MCYWIMFTIVSGTDVVLEGPHGGIWFWAVAGFAIALERIRPVSD